jgi:hypothetical protein
MFLPWPVVVDADVLYRNIDFAVRWRNPGALLGQASRSYSLISGIVLFAAAEVRDEAVRHMPDIARRRGVSLDVVEEAWREMIVPSVRFVEVGADVVNDPRLEGVDPKDLPSARLAALLAPAVLATDNRKHYRPFAIPDTKTDAIAKDLFTLGRFGTGTKGVMLFPMLGSAAATEGSKKVIAKLGSDSAALIGLLILGGLVYFLSTDRGRSLRSRLGEVARDAGPPLAEMMANVTAAEDRVSAFAVDRVGDPNALALVARRLATGQTVMTTVEIADTLRMNGFGFDGSRAHRTATRAWLELTPCFCEADRGRWTLGYHLARGAD